MATNFHTDWSDSSTQFTAASMNPALQDLDAAVSSGLRIRSVTDLVDTAVTLTAAQLMTGIIKCTPTTARNQTLPTAAAIIAALPYHPTGTSYVFTVVNTAAFNETLLTNTGLTLLGNMVVNNASATFIVLVTSGTTCTVVRI
jgi:hypothetical protein